VSTKNFIDLSYAFDAKMKLSKKCLVKNRDFRQKKSADIIPLRPFTLAAFLPWGSSKGAGYVSRVQM